MSTPTQPPSFGESLNKVREMRKALVATQRELYDTIEQRNKLRALAADALARLLYAQAAITVAREDNDYCGECRFLRRDFHSLAALTGSPMDAEMTQILVKVANNARTGREVSKALV